MTGAVVMNSWTPGVPVALIGERVMTDSSRLAALLGRVYATEAWVVP